MTESDVRRAVAEVLATVAPEADLGNLAPGEPLRQGLDLDSYDFLSLLVGLADRLGVEVPESDYARVDTLEGLVAWFAARATVA